MQILIACAKTMADNSPAVELPASIPAFQSCADELALQLSRYTPDELQALLGVNQQLARQNWLRYQNFFETSTRIPAVFAYDGMAYRKLGPESMTAADLRYAQSHLFIGSFLYGLLRPLDLINQYRLEGKVELPAAGGLTLFKYWRPIITRWFVDKVKADDGILVNLASGEFKEIFDWDVVERELTVITPEFKVEKNGKLRTVVIYAKMCRGAMARWIILNRVSDLALLPTFEYEGFRHESDWTFALR